MSHRRWGGGCDGLELLQKHELLIVTLWPVDDCDLSLGASVPHGDSCSDGVLGLEVLNVGKAEIALIDCKQDAPSRLDSRERRKRICKTLSNSLHNNVCIYLLQFCLLQADYGGSCVPYQLTDGITPCCVV